MNQIRDNVFIGNVGEVPDPNDEVTVILSLGDFGHIFEVGSEVVHYQVPLSAKTEDPIVAACALMLLNGLLRKGETVLVYGPQAVIVVAAQLTASGEYWSLEDGVTDIKRSVSKSEETLEMLNMYDRILKSSVQ